jgi:RNA:NAD 2'-phosphotransferase (TPT1/KptA family)
MKERYVGVSKFPSLVPRHKPEKVGVALDREGRVSVSRLLEALEAHGLRLTPDELHEASAPQTLGSPVVLSIAGGATARGGASVLPLGERVRLTEHIPARYITFGDDERRRIFFLPLKLSVSFTLSTS